MNFNFFSFDSLIYNNLRTSRVLSTELSKVSERVRSLSLERALISGLAEIGQGGNCKQNCALSKKKVKQKKFFANNQRDSFILNE